MNIRTGITHHTDTNSANNTKNSSYHKHNTDSNNIRVRPTAKKM